MYDTTVVPIADTAWDAVCVMSFWDAYTAVMAAPAWLIAAGLAIVAACLLLLRRFHVKWKTPACLMRSPSRSCRGKVMTMGDRSADIAG